MIKKNTCGQCGGEIELDRLAVLDTPICAACAANTAGNILTDIRPEPMAVEGIGGVGKAVFVCTTWPDAFGALQELLKTFDEVRIRKTHLEPK